MNSSRTCLLQSFPLDRNHAAYEACQSHIEAGIRERCARLAPDVIGQDRAEATWEIEKAARENFRWQRFLSKGRLKQHAADFVQAVAKSTLPFVQYEVARIADRKEPFARRSFNIFLRKSHTHAFTGIPPLSSIFFGTLIRAGRNDDGSLRMSPCLLKNHNGRICNNLCDPFGHHCFA